jgi:hypothetical protein
MDDLHLHHSDRFEITPFGGVNQHQAPSPLKLENSSAGLAA